MSDLLELEPYLDMGEIQGNIFEGFNKDFQAFLFFSYGPQPADLTPVRAWISGLAERIAWLKDVVAFKKQFRALAAGMTGADPGPLSTCWINVGFSHPGLARLHGDAAQFDDVFRGGLPSAVGRLGDPKKPEQRGHISRWLFGGRDSVPDVVLLLASDDEPKLEAGMLAEREKATAAGLREVHTDLGRDLARWNVTPPFPSGHEHFGFKDGVSQPGVRGRVSSAADDYLTPRPAAAADPGNGIEYGKPGQALVCPGEFVLGYPRQSDIDPRRAAYPYELGTAGNGGKIAGPAWAKNGSFLVYRRLAQDVPAFNQFLTRQAAELAKSAEFAGLKEDRLGALLVGRWRSGAPVLRSPNNDDETLGTITGSNNAFTFATNLNSQDGYSSAPSDPEGEVCPAASHIRKVNPRGLNTDQGGPAGTLVRRILRRGIPYGRPLPVGALSDSASEDRGLLFLCYQASIRDQFEFLCSSWANDESKPTPQLTPNSGIDLILGQSPRGDRVRYLMLGEQRIETRADEEWVYPTGGGYFFAPARDALVNVLGAALVA
jgi:Dyp-type peroxidase family